MTLHTVIPDELVWEGLSVGPNLVKTAVAGVDLLVEVLPGGQGRVSRLLSTDPYDFLDPRFQPGTLVALA